MSTAEWATHWAAKYSVGSLESRTLARAALLATGAELHVSTADASNASAELGSDYQEALARVAGAGWLAPIEVLPDGSLRTRLTLPAGVML